MTEYLPKYREAVRNSLYYMGILEAPDRDNPSEGWTRKHEAVPVRGRGSVNAVTGVLDELAKTEPWHIVEITETGWTLSHPIVERLTGELLDCPAGGHVGSHETPPLPPGRYRMIDAGESWEFFLLEP